MMQADPDLQDPVIELARGAVRVAPEELERLVLLEVLARVELLDAVDQLGRRRVVAIADGPVGRWSLGSALRLALASEGRGIPRLGITRGRARSRSPHGIEARPP